MREIEDKVKELQKIPGLYEFVFENCFLAGGAIRDVMRGVKPKDWDIFFRTDTAKDEFIKKFSNRMTVTGLGNYNWEDFQFITLYTGSPSHVINKFDWNVNQHFYEFGKPKPKYYIPSELRFNTDCEKPLSAYLRLPDMIKKGFTISKEELIFVLTFISGKVKFDNLEQEFEWVSSGGGFIGAGAANNAVERAKKDLKHPRHTKLAKALR